MGEGLFCRLPSPTSDPVCYTLHSDFWDLILKLSQRLAPRQQFVFWQFHWHDKSVNEIAQSIERTPNATHQILFRAHKRMQKLMEQAGLDEELMRRYAVCQPFTGGRPSPGWLGQDHDG